MTRISKIKTLTEVFGEKIKYHYRTGQNYRRLVIDLIDDMEFNSSTEDQKRANKLIDEMHKEALGYGYEE